MAPYGYSNLNDTHLSDHYNIRSGPYLRHGLIAVVVFSFLSLFASLYLLFTLAFRLINQKRTFGTLNQSTILICNLTFANLQQSAGYVVSIKWIVDNILAIATSSCWIQGLFITTGDVASVAFCFLIALQALLTGLFKVHMGARVFSASIVVTWMFVYTLALVGITTHHTDLYSGTSGWCWVNTKYSELTIWLHHFWFIVSAFGATVVFSIMCMVRRRDYGKYNLAYSEMKLTALYPLAYVLCNLPLAILGIASLASSGSQMSIGWSCFAGVLSTSNGWINVLLYAQIGPADYSSKTALPLASHEPEAMPWTAAIAGFLPDRVHGTWTVCEYAGNSEKESWKESNSSFGSSMDITKTIVVEVTNESIIKRNE